MHSRLWLGLAGTGCSSVQGASRCLASSIDSRSEMMFRTQPSAPQGGKMSQHMDSLKGEANVVRHWCATSMLHASCRF